MWTYKFSDHGGYDCMTHAYRIKDGNKSIADIDLSAYGQELCDYSFRSDEAEKNARLIAAAPDMLEALKLIEENCQHDGIGSRYGSFSWNSPCGKKLRAAIEKATLRLGKE